MHSLYPSNPFSKNKPDESYAEKFLATQAIGIPCSLYSAEDFDNAAFKPHSSLPETQKIICRGRMLTPEDYAQLQAAIKTQGARALTPANHYHQPGVVRIMH